MGSTNFQFFNTSQANQETDAQWLADSIRVGGVAVDDILPSPFLNKLWYQGNNGVACLMTMMADKGFTTLDTNLATLTAVLANILTTADLPLGLQSVPWSSSPVFNAARYNSFEVTLQGTTSFTISGQAAGQVIGLLWMQDSTGGRVVVFPSNVVGGAQPDPTPGLLSCQLFKVDAALNLYAVGPAVSTNGMRGLAVNALTLSVAGAAPSGQVLTGNGTSYVPVTAPGYTSGSNANGWWQKDPTGKIEQWGTIVGGVGGTMPYANFNFPVPFTNAASIAIAGNAMTCVNGDALSIAGDVPIVCFDSYAIGGARWRMDSNKGDGFSSLAAFSWRAVGY